MNLQLPNGDRISLPNHTNIEERMFEVENLIEEFDIYITNNPLSPKIIYFLNGLSNYLVWFKDEDSINKNDKEVLSKDKMSKMNKYDSNSIPFSSLSPDEQSKYGISETEVDK